MSASGSDSEYTSSSGSESGSDWDSDEEAAIDDFLAETTAVAESFQIRFEQKEKLSVKQKTKREAQKKEMKQDKEFVAFEAGVSAKKGA
jgi:hypothetical protein